MAGERFARVTLVFFALGLAACPSPPESLFLGDVLSVSLAVGESVHVSLRANEFAVAEANDGLRITATARAPVREIIRLRVIPNDARLDGLHYQYVGGGGASAWAGLRGGSLPPVCMSGLPDCTIGATIELVDAEGPVDLDVHVGVLRSGRAGLWGCGTEPREFSDEAAATGVID